MAEHRSGSARRRKRRLAALMAQVTDAERRISAGGEAISVAVSALHGVRILAAGCVNGMDITPDELACLLGLIADEIEAGLNLQHAA